MFRKALALEPESIAAHFNLGMALREKGDLDAALHHLRRVVEAEAGNAAVHYELGQTLRQSGELGGAIAEFERALEINPELREGYYALGAALKQQSATARRPAPPPSSPADEAVARAKAAAARNDLKTAGDALADALQRDANHAEAHTLQGYVLGQQGNLSAALPHLQRADESFVRNRPRHGTTSARPCGTAARERRRLPNCARACGSIPGRRAGMLFSAWRCSKPAISPVPARASNVRWRCHPRWRPLTSISASPSCGRGIWKRVLGSSKPG